MAEIPRVVLHPGMVTAHAREHLVATLLGSCVAVCLMDGALGIGGMNHFMLPFWNGEGLPTPRYGNVAMERLLERLIRLGCNPHRLQAKVFGGAHVLGLDSVAFDIGQRNVDLALASLAQLGIPLVASEVGGDTGYRLLFNTRTGLVLLRRMSRPEQLDLPEGRRRPTHPRRG